MVSWNTIEGFMTKIKFYRMMTEVFGLIGLVGIAIAAFTTSFLAGVVCVSLECFLLSYASNLVVDECKKNNDSRTP